jgi:hypothetical protein
MLRQMLFWRLDMHAEQLFVLDGTKILDGEINDHDVSIVYWCSFCGIISENRSLTRFKSGFKWLRNTVLRAVFFGGK